MNNLMVLEKQFEGTDIEITTGDNGEILFEVYSTGSALGYVKTKIVKGKEYKEIRKDRIEKVMKNADISGLPHDGGIYLNEEMLYDFMLEAKTEKVKPFRKWVTSEVLPSLRKTGTYAITTPQPNEALASLVQSTMMAIRNYRRCLFVY